MNYLKEHWEILSAFTIGIFSFGGLYSGHSDLKKRVDKFDLIHKDILEIKTFMAKIEERTKHL